MSAAVHAECTREASKPGATVLIEARTSGILDIRDDSTASSLLGTQPALGAGEIAALTMALDLGRPLLMDERLGRTVAAVRKSGERRDTAHGQGPRPDCRDRAGPRGVALLGYFLSPQLVESVLRRAG